MADLRQRRSDLKRQVRDAAKEERNLAKKRQRLMQVGEPGTKSKLSLSVANGCGRPPRICRLVTCSSCCSVPTSKALMVDLCSDVLRMSNARVRKQARESGQASWPATNARVSRQQTRESADNKRASQAKKKPIRESPARKRPKEAESPARKRPKEAEHPTDTASFGPLARWPVAFLAGFCIP